MPYVYSPYFTYTPFISGLMGMVLIYYFVIFSIDLGARIIKLMVLQVISPIPVIMYTDPSQKNKLTNFFKAYSVLYLQVFLRIITLYMAFVVLDLVVNSDAFNTAINGGMLLAGNFFVKIILYIGVFQATKELPKLIEDALGVKMGSAPGGNSFGKVLAGVAGGAFGFTAGAIAGGVAGKSSGVAGVTGGALMGAATGMLSGGAGFIGSKNVAEGVKSAVKSVKDASSTGKRVAATGNLFNYARGNFDNLIGYPGRVDTKVKNTKDKLEKMDAFEKAVFDDYSKTVDPTTGFKYGTLDEDFGVIAARGARDQFISDYNEGKAIDPTTGAVYTPAAAAARLNTLRASVKTQEDAYKQKAFDWFQAKSLDPTTGKVKYDPKKYATLSESEKAHHELTRTTKKTLIPSSRSDLRTDFSAMRKTIKADSKKYQAQSQTDRARNARAVSDKK